MDDAVTSPPTTLSARLQLLHDVRAQLFTATTADAMCRMAVELGHARLGFDRLSLWFADGPEQARGSYGIDESGAVRDERGAVVGIAPSSPMGRVLTGATDLVIEHDDALLNHTITNVGHGMHMLAALWDGIHVLGAVSTDNLLSGAAFTDDDGEVLRLYASIIGHLYLQRQSEAEQRTLQQISDYALTHSLDELIQYTLDQAEQFTGSAIGFFHFLDDDTGMLTLQTWSTHTRGQMCTADGHDAHYPIREAGVWVDCVHQRRPVLHNDYATLPHRKGLPDGHAPVVRELTVPVIQHERIVAIIGVGNKPNPYTEHDVQLVSDFAHLVLDIIARKRAEEALRDSEARWHSYIEHAPYAIYLADETGHYLEANPEACRSTGYTEAELLTMRIADLLPAEYAHEGADHFARVMHDGSAHGELRYQCKDGSLHWASISAVKLSNTRFLAFAHDITARKEAVAALKESYDRFIQLAEQSHTVLWEVDAGGLYTYVSPVAAHLYGYAPEEIIGRLHFYDLHPEEGREAFIAAAFAVFERQGLFEGIENAIVTKDGRQVWVTTYGIPLLNTEGELVGYRGSDIDITARKLAEAEGERLQGQLAQMQKMESIGRLAGGVAHDFNNMLNVILGNAEMAMAQVDPAAPIAADLQEITRAAERSADLTRQLLAFARKQTVVPRILNLNETIAGMLKMLRRLIGEDINLTWVPGSEPWPVKVDPSQIDQLLANLCVNARDAITGVGRVTIETSNIHCDDAYCTGHGGMPPGDYLLLSVSDDGCGMSGETMGHIFEPFFSTKGVGEGTGLGLATVYGVVSQNSGFIDVYSEPGIGTTFSIYLPRHRMADAQPIAADTPAATPRGRETVLLVEDEPSILRLGQRILEGQGYHVLTAPTPGEAMRLAEEYPGEIDLLMTDVVMPEMNGRDLARNLLSRYPSMKRLFMSGYTANVIASHGVLDNGVNFLQKPFTLHDLTTKVREVLDQ